MTLSLIRLELARTKGYPEGSSTCGYEFRAPLDAEGHLDLESFNRHRKDCLVRRFWDNEDDQHGLLEHGRGGVWKFTYGEEDEEEEPLFKLDRHLFKVGEYVSITEESGEKMPFRVIYVKPMTVG